MRSESAIWVVTGGLVLIFGLMVGVGASGAGVLFIAVLGTIMSMFIGSSMARPVDAKWLTRWVVIGFVAKLGGTAARYYMVTKIYGLGDSYRYYTTGVELASRWRDGRVPGLTGSGSFGTQVIEAFTGGIFAIVTPDMLGGFLMFSIIAFLGQLLLYAAFRRHAKPHQLKPYAILLFLLPTYAFWPSSIGKDAVVLLALGAAAYCVSRALEAFQIRWLLAFAVALAALGLVRIHIAGLVVAAFVLTALIARVPSRGDDGVVFRRFMTLGAGLAGAVLVISLFPGIFGVDILSAQDREGFTADIVRRTSEDGTVAEGSTVQTPLDLPGALSHVLFRPYIFEASEFQHYFAAAETTLLILLTIWRLPAALKNLGKWRSNPYVVFCTFYTLGFAAAFSVVRNLGIIARQRGQVLAFFLCFIIALGWPEEEKPRVLTPADQPIALTR